MLKCDLHDYLEIAAMFNIPVALTSESGKRIEGIIADIFIDAERQESVKLVDKGNSEVVPTNALVSMKALVNNTHFDEVSLK